MAHKPIVLLPTDVKELDGYLWHATVEQYIRALADVSNVVPVLVPSIGDTASVDALLAMSHGVLLTGSRSNVHPGHFGTDPDPAFEPYDPARDATTLPLIRAAIDRGVPLLAICRGHQELNVALGGSLMTEIQDQPERMDHRAPEHPDNDERFAIRQAVHVKPGSHLHTILGAEEVAVNSLHRQAVDRLADQLIVEAEAPDGTIEAVRVEGARAFALGIQWHPEYWAGKDPASTKIFQAFGEACRDYLRKGEAATPKPASAA